MLLQSSITAEMLVGKGTVPVQAIYYKEGFGRKGEPRDHASAGEAPAYASTLLSFESSRIGPGHLARSCSRA